LPTNIIDAIEDMMAIHKDLLPAAERLSERARSNMDVVALSEINRIVVGLAKLDRLARSARRGEYGGTR